MTQAPIEVDFNREETLVMITNYSKCQMYAGDRGTDVCATVELNKDQLKAHICALIKAWRKLK